MDFKEDHEDDSLGIGLKVMVAAAFSLFAIVLFIIFLHFYSRHIRRCQQRRHHDQLSQIISSQVAPLDLSFMEPSRNQGLDPLIIASLPKLLYKQTDQFSQGEVIECSVCLGTIVEDAAIRVLPNCKHMFHVDCVDTWFGSNTTCPICRTVAEPRVQSGDGHLGTLVQPTALPEDANNELGEVGGSGLRISSFHRMVSRERSLRRDRSSDGSATIEDIERV